MTATIIDRMASGPPTIDDDITRRGFVIGAGIAGLLAAAGCGRDRNDEPTPAAAEPNFPVTVTHLFGTTEITRTPERVVALSTSPADMAAALGVPRTTRSSPLHPWAPTHRRGTCSRCRPTRRGDVCRSLRY